MKQMRSLDGNKYGRLTVIKTFRENGRTKVECICECGNTKVILADNLKRGKIKSCGCYHDEAAKDNNIIHGLKHTRIYNIFMGMKNRCFNKNNQAYSRYGGKGITICEEWLNNPKAFYDWAIDNGYNDKLSIDRIDSNGNYEPSNCRWANRKIQSQNRNNVQSYTYNGETHCLSEWAEILSIKRSVLFWRLNHGWSIEKAFETR